MTRFLAFISCLLLVFGLCIGASAADDLSASSVNILATVSPNGSCEVNVAVTLHADTPKSKLTFPVPVGASNITLNGKPIFTEKTSQARIVDLGSPFNNVAGDYSFTLTYSIHSVVKPVVSTEEEETTTKRMQLELPLLAGFAYPIEQFQFSINLPGSATVHPSFASGYHQADIEKDLTYSVSGGNIAGRSWRALKDHETLTMSLVTTEEMFPATRADLPVVEDVTVLITICAALAALFWLIFLRNYLPLRTFPAVPPEGFEAGQFGTVLTMAGADLHLMVFSWAQLGYVALGLDRRGRVYILKQMDMGNERTPFEQKCFRLLFSRRELVDTSSGSYQRLVNTVRVQRSAQQLFRRRNGALYAKIFRGITAAAGLFSGTCFGILLGNMLDYGWFFMVILSAVGLICSWQIQLWPEGLVLRHRMHLWTSAILCVLWLALGIAIQQFPLALTAVSIQVIGGFLAAFGGRRTEEGRAAMGQTLSLRQYLKKITPKQAQQLCQSNPEVFFDMAPYAIALGCDRAFSRSFGKSRLPVCPYIQADNTRGLTAQQWCQLMRQILGGMSARRRKNPMTGFRSVMRNFMR